MNIENGNKPNKSTGIGVANRLFSQAEKATPKINRIILPESKKLTIAPFTLTFKATCLVSLTFPLQIPSKGF